MITTPWTRARGAGKCFVLLLAVLAFPACSANPATGEQQFTAFMPASQEAAIGAQEHEKVRQTFGDFIAGPVADYVSSVGRKVAANTERQDVQYKFYVVDSPTVNAFALPGGYIYVTRGLMALANSESELAAVIAHEIGHVTARHAAERSSQGMLVSLGAAVLSAAVNAPGVDKVAGLGSELYIKSYSRGQEHQADELGVRYLHRAEYDPFAMERFLENLEASTVLEQKIAGREGTSPVMNYFSTHPQTRDRIAHAGAEAAGYSNAAAMVNRDGYLRVLDGMVYGDSAAQGFVKGRSFYHPGIGFMFTVPAGFQIMNQPNEVVAADKNGTVILVDTGADSSTSDPALYIGRTWMRGEPVPAPEKIDINGMAAATTSFNGNVNGRPATIRLVAIAWKPRQFFRFQMAIPRSAPEALVEDLKRTTYSFRPMTDAEKQEVRPQRLDLFAASPGEGLSTIAARLPFEDFREDRLRVLNGIKPGQGLRPGTLYKTVIQ